MTTAADTPHADKLEIFASPNGKWVVFTFHVGDKQALVSMDTDKIPDAFQSFLSALNVPALAAVTGEPLASHGYFYAEAVRPHEGASSTTPLGDNVVVAFGLPGGAHFSALLDLTSAKKLRLALDEAILHCEKQDQLTKQ